MLKDNKRGLYFQHMMNKSSMAVLEKYIINE